MLKTKREELQIPERGRARGGSSVRRALDVALRRCSAGTDQQSADYAYQFGFKSAVLLQQLY